MKRTCTALLVLFLGLFLGACAHLRGGDPQARQRAELWTEAHLAFHTEDFRHARTTFQRLADEHPDTGEGREALFYLGTLSLDPRNPEWSPDPAAQLLRQYLALDTARAVIHRRPEAVTLLRLADQLVTPPPAQPEGPAAPPTGADAPGRPARNVVSIAEYRALQAEVDTLRRQLAEREERIRRQNEELERIRRVLTPRTP